MWGVRGWFYSNPRHFTRKTNDVSKWEYYRGEITDSCCWVVVSFSFHCDPVLSFSLPFSRPILTLCSFMYAGCKVTATSTVISIQIQIHSFEIDAEEGSEEIGDLESREGWFEAWEGWFGGTLKKTKKCTNGQTLNIPVIYRTSSSLRPLSKKPQNRPNSAGKIEWESN